MPFTQADADAVQAAIVELATGKRVVSITFAGPPQRSETFQMVQINELNELLAKINRQLSPGGTYRLAATRKGLGA